MQRLKFPDLLERHLGSHHLHKGLRNGWLATVWLASSHARHEELAHFRVGVLVHDPRRREPMSRISVAADQFVLVCGLMIDSMAWYDGLTVCRGSPWVSTQRALAG